MEDQRCLQQAEDGAGTAVLAALGCHGHRNALSGCRGFGRSGRGLGGAGSPGGGGVTTGAQGLHCAVDHGGDVDGDVGGSGGVNVRPGCSRGDVVCHPCCAGG